MACGSAPHTVREGNAILISLIVRAGGSAPPHTAREALQYYSCTMDLEACRDEGFCRLCGNECIVRPALLVVGLFLVFCCCVKW
jgi:hypothetical protein